MKHNSLLFDNDSVKILVKINREPSRMFTIFFPVYGPHGSKRVRLNRQDLGSNSKGWGKRRRVFWFARIKVFVIVH